MWRGSRHIILVERGRSAARHLLYMKFQVGGWRGEALAQTLLTCVQQPQLLFSTPSLPPPPPFHPPPPPPPPHPHRHNRRLARSCVRLQAHSSTPANGKSPAIDATTCSSAASGS